MSTEGWTAVMCVLLAFILGGALLAQGGGAPAPAAPEQSAFAGGPDDTDAIERRRSSGKRSSAHPRASGRPVVSVRRGRSVYLYERPGGPPRYVLRARTPFGSRTTMPVVRRRGRWLGVITSALGNGRTGWIRDDARALDHGRSPIRLVVDRSERRLTVFRKGRAVEALDVGMGRQGSETPLGHFAVTDKLPGARYPASYGCCILALSGRQTRLPAGWQGGDRLAIHGTTGRSAASVASAGCVVVSAEPLRRLMRTVPLGTVVTVEP